MPIASMLSFLQKRKFRVLLILLIQLSFIFMTIGVDNSMAQIRIMPLGDSITHGEHGSTPTIGGFRDDLAFMLLSESVDFDLVGTFNDGQSAFPWHQGDPGKTAGYIASHLPNWLSETYPDLILFHIGTNDVYSLYTTQRIIDDIERNLDHIWSFGEDIPVLLCSTIPRNDIKNDRNTELARAIHDLVIDKIRDNYPVRYVGQNEVFVENPNWADDYLHDLWHPNNLGYSIMAEVYFNVLMTELTAGRQLVTDNFNRSQFGQFSWKYDGHYELQNDKLTIDTGGNYWWKPAVYIAEMDPIAVSFTFGENVDAYTDGNAGIALMLDDNSQNADGYLVYKESETTNLKLYYIQNGQISQLVDEVPGFSGTPVIDDTFKVAFYSDDDGNHFNCMINDQFDGKLTDQSKLHNNNSNQFAGLMLAGIQNNIVDDFTLIHYEFQPEKMILVSGDGQVGEKETTLSDSIVIEVTDNYGSPISNVPVNFEITSGDATIVENNTSNHIVFEAEDGILTYPMQIRSHSTASGGKYITVPQEYPDDTMAKAVYDFSVSSGGTYVIWGLVRSAGDTHDSFKIIMDDQDEIVWHISGFWDWTWDQVYIYNGDDPVQLNLAPGAHSLTVKNREWGSQIDKLIITNDLGFNPNSFLAKSYETVITNTSGKAYAKVQLGSTPGPIEVTASSPALQEQVVFNLSIKSDEPIPTILAITGGDNQTEEINQVLPLPMEVKVTDSENNPMSNVSVLFEILQGTGSIAEIQPVLTDVNGLAHIYFTLGAEEGERLIQASCPDHPQIQPVIFHATGVQTGYSISGSITYFSNDNPVDDVALTCMGDLISVDSTDVSGSYTINSIQLGDNIVLTPTKLDFTNVDNSLAFMYNAALTMKHVVKLDTLEGYYLEAADVDKNGLVQTYDAALIAHYAVGLNKGQDSHVGEWQFHPPYRQYFQVSTNYSSQDYLTLILGDVAGGWEQNNVIEKSVPGNMLKNSNQISARSGSTFSIPIWIEGDMNMISCDLMVKYDQNVVRFVDIEKTVLSQGFEIVSNEMNGVLVAGLYGAYEINSSGVIFKLIFEAAGNVEQSTAIEIERFRINNHVAEYTTAVVNIQDDVAKPNDFTLYQNYPNPFNPETIIPFQIPESGEVKITIFNLLGQQIITVLDGVENAGLHEVRWNGLDSYGNHVAGGLYVCETRFKDQRKTIKLMKLE